MNEKCYNPFGCALLSLLAGVVIGVVSAILVATGTITLSPVFSIVAFGIATGALALLFGVSAIVGKRKRECIEKYLGITLSGILGTILTSVIILAFGFVATSIAGAIVLGFLAAFFTLLITSAVCTIKCFVED